VVDDGKKRIEKNSVKDNNSNRKVEDSMAREFLEEVNRSASQLKKEFTLTIPRTEIEKKLEEKARLYQPNLRLQGFRRGKVPLEVVQAQFKSELEGEVIREVTQKEVAGKMQSEKLRPVGQPVVQKMDFPEGKDLTLGFEVEIFPEVDLSDLENLTVEATAGELEYPEFQEEESIRQLLKNRGKYELKKDQTVENGDMVVYTIQSTNTKTRKKTPKQKERLVVSPDRPSDILEVTREVLGKKAGDRLVFKRRYPRDHARKPWAGKEMEHQLELEKVFELRERELNEAFFAEMGVRNRGELKERMKEEYRQARDQFLQNRKMELILDDICRRKEFPVPRSLMDESVSKARMQVQKIKNDGGEDRDRKILEVYRDIHRSIKKAFIINTLKAEKKIRADEKKMDEKIRELAERQNIPFGQFKKLLAGNPQYLDQVRTDVENELIRDYLLTAVKVREVQS